jgi:hypothetical protein
MIADLIGCGYSLSAGGCMMMWRYPSIGIAEKICDSHHTADNM